MLRGARDIRMRIVPGGPGLRTGARSRRHVVHERKAALQARSHDGADPFGHEFAHGPGRVEREIEASYRRRHALARNPGSRLRWTDGCRSPDHGTAFDYAERLIASRTGGPRGGLRSADATVSL